MYSSRFEEAYREVCAENDLIAWGHDLGIEATASARKKAIEVVDGAICASDMLIVLIVYPDLR